MVKLEDAAGNQDVAQIDAPAIDAAVAPDVPADVLSIDAPLPCSAAGLMCPGGMTAAITCNGACWAKCTEPGTTPIPDQQTAETWCGQWGGKLAPILSAADQTCVDTMLFPMQASWIGIVQGLNEATPAAGWSWNGDGVTPSYQHWSNGQPDDANDQENGAEQCAYMPTFALWFDVPCDMQLFRFSCRR